MSDKSKIRLYVEESLNQGVSIRVHDGKVNYIANVMRRKIADEVVLFNGKDGEWLSQIGHISKKEIGLNVIKKLKDQKPEPDVWLVFAPIKVGRIDYMIEKAVELGVASLHPVITERTIVTRVNIDRLQAHAVEAAEQCERLNVPKVNTEEKLHKLIEKWPSDRAIIFCDETGRGRPIVELLPEIKENKYAIFIGPEGGFTENEFKLLLKMKNVYPLHLGPRVMRADTAAISALACFQALKGDWSESPEFRK